MPCTWIRGLLVGTGLCVTAGAAGQEIEAVSLGDGTQELRAVNPGIAPVTFVVRFESRENLVVDRRTPIAEVVPAGQREPLVLARLGAEDPSRPYRYRYSATWRLGSYQAHHDGAHVYSLPYEVDKRVQVSQGFEGGYSHHGKYAVDWGMPEGSRVYAARAGLVVQSVSHHRVGGTTPEFYEKANRVRVLHDDGSIATYAHLQHEGAKVSVGERVVAGQWIGLSGNTGFSSGPHLHFEVSVPRRLSGRNTFAVRFATAEKGVVELARGEAYSRFPEAVHQAPSEEADPAATASLSFASRYVGPFVLLGVGVLVMVGFAARALRG